MKTNVTISVEEEVVQRAREVARKEGATLNALLRRYMEVLAGRRAGGDVATELMELFRAEGGRSGGRTFTRDDAYEGRT